MKRRIGWDSIFLFALLGIGSLLTFWRGTSKVGSSSETLLYLLFVGITGGVLIISDRLQAINRLLMEVISGFETPDWNEPVNLVNKALDTQTIALQDAFRLQIEAENAARQSQTSAILETDREQTQVLVRALREHTQALEDVTAALRTRDRLPELALEVLPQGESTGAYRDEAVQELHFIDQRGGRKKTGCALRLCNHGRQTATRLYLSFELIFPEEFRSTFLVEYNVSKQNFLRAASVRRHSNEFSPGWTLRFAPDLVIYPVSDDCPIVAELELTTTARNMSVNADLRYRVFAFEGNQVTQATEDGWERIPLTFIL